MKKIIVLWEDNYNEYTVIEKKCIDNINNINEIKNNLTKIFGTQRSDDIIFYKSIIDNSYFYINNSFKIRKNKFVKDLNYIWSQINECVQIDDINKKTFTALLRDFVKKDNDIKIQKQNNTKLKWLKNNDIFNIIDIVNNMSDIMKYHVNSFRCFLQFIELEFTFYSNHRLKNIPSEDINTLKINNIEHMGYVSKSNDVPINVEHTGYVSKSNLPINMNEHAGYVSKSNLPINMNEHAGYVSKSNLPINMNEHAGYVSKSQASSNNIDSKLLFSV